MAPRLKHRPYSKEFFIFCILRSVLLHNSLVCPWVYPCCCCLCSGTCFPPPNLVVPYSCPWLPLAAVGCVQGSKVGKNTASLQQAVPKQCLDLAIKTERTQTCTEAVSPSAQRKVEPTSPDQRPKSWTLKARNTTLPEESADVY